MVNPVVSETSLVNVNSQIQRNSQVYTIAYENIKRSQMVCVV